MESLDNFWDKLSTIDSLHVLKTEILNLADSQIEWAEYCIENCLKNMSQLYEIIKDRRIVIPDLEDYISAFHDNIMALERAKDFVNYT